MMEGDVNTETEITQKQGVIKRLQNTGQLTRLIVYMSAAIPAVICIFFALLASVNVLQPWRIQSGESEIVLGAAIDYLIIGTIIFTGVYGLYEFFHIRRVRKIDERFPDFVRDLAESRRAGMTFTKAIMYSSRGNYGVLTPEIQKIARQISWGSSVENALGAFAKRVNTKLVKRTVSLIIEASRSGGNVADVLDAASRDAREIKLIDAERRAGMLSYVAVVYVGMFVFLVIMIVLCKSLLPAMMGQGSAGMATTMGKSSDISQTDITYVFFYAALIQTAGMGAVTGVFEEGNVVSGVKHIFIMILITWIIFKFFVMGV
jgi:flagellar protein FlaJ